MVCFYIIPICLLFGCILASIIRHYFPTKEKNLPPGCMGWPLLGETLGYLKPHNSNSPGNFLQDHCSRYGKVFKSNLFGSPTIVSCDLDLNTFVLQHEEKLFKADYPKPVHDILGDLSMLIVVGDHHKMLRSYAICFINTSKSSPNFLNYVEKLSVSMMDSWNERKHVRFCKEAKQFALDVIVKIVLSIEQEDPKATKILQDFRTFMKGFVSLPIPLPGTSYSKAVKARASLTSTMKEIIQVRKQGRFVWPNGDFLDLMLSKGGLGDDQIASILIDLLLAGHDTTAILMPLIVYFLAHAPLVVQKLKEEHESIRRSKRDGENLNWDDYKKMEFTTNVRHVQYYYALTTELLTTGTVILEALRCGNIVKFVHRKALQDVKYKDYVIPAGWQVLPVFTAAHFDSSIHENPFKFNPWRWNEESMSRKVTPFGGGLRLCPGIDLAKVEMAFFLHHFVLRYRWKTSEDDMPFAYPYVEFPKGLELEIKSIIQH